MEYGYGEKGEDSMRNLLLAVFSIVVLSACNQAETENTESIEVKNVEDIVIFETDQNNESISEDEIKSNLKSYLDSSGDLQRAMFQLEEVLYSGEALDEVDVETFQQLNTLIKENDENFSTYISTNTLPEEYKAEAEHISLYITASNQYLDELDESIDTFINELVDGEISLETITSLGDGSGIVNGKEQAKIEAFLEEKGIETNAFIID